MTRSRASVPTRSRWIAAILIALTLGCSEEERPLRAFPPTTGPPSFLLVTLDTTRADHIGAYGADFAITPTLDRLAREGILFEQAIAPTPITFPSHATMLTGVIPPEHGIRDNTLFRLDPEARLVSEALRRNGWRTGAFVGSFVLDGSYGLDQGFEVYHAPKQNRLTPEARRGERGADKVVSDAIAWLATLDPEEPYFAWLHFFDPHSPWMPPDRFHREMASPYDGEITFCDEQLGRLLEWLARQGRDTNLLTIVTADHGEGLGDHGEDSHGLLLYQSTLRVPLIIHGPWVSTAQGSSISEPVGTVNLARTILSIAGLSSEELPNARGSSLIVDGAAAPPVEGRAVYIETMSPNYSFGWSAARGVVWQQNKLIDSQSPELFNLDDDPEEVKNLAPTDPAQVDRMRAKLTSLLERGSLGWGRRRTLASEEAQLLESLGYIAGRLGEDPFAANLVPARDRLDHILRISEALALIQRATVGVPNDPARQATVPPEQREEGLEFLKAARHILRKLHAEDPHNPAVCTYLGHTEAQLERHKAARPLLECGVAAYPTRARLRYLLALTYWELGRDAEARAAMRAAQRIEPDDAYYKIWLENHPLRERPVQTGIP